MDARGEGLEEETVTIGTLFSGIDGFGLGLELAGLGSVIWQVENNPACIQVLSRHWQRAERHGDIRTVRGRDLERADIICLGFPCQNLSIAGKRVGLSGERSGLFYEAVRVINELKESGRPPVFILWENVPGLSSSDEGRDFARVLISLADIGYFGAGRILDAQYFGLAQRRRRWIGLFARGDIGAECCAEILSLSEGMRWHPAPRREAGKGFAADIVPSLTGSGRGVERAGESRGQDPVVAVAGTVSSKWAKGTGGPSGDEVQNLIPVTPPSDSKHVCGRNTGMVQGGNNPPIILDIWSESLYNKGITHNKEETDNASAQENDPGALLRVLREKIGEKAFAEWGLGVLDSLQQKEILQSNVYGEGFRQETQSRCKMVNGTLSSEADNSTGDMFCLWGKESKGCSSQRWEPSEQFRREFATYMSELSQFNTSQKKALLCLWEASEGIWILREALSKIQKIWRSTNDKSESTYPSLQVRRITPREAERLQGFQWRCSPDYPGAW